MPSKSDEYIIADFLPRREISLISGGSGVGKSRFLLNNIIAEWQEGREIFGHESYPLPYVYISVDRSRASVIRTLTTMGLEDKIIRFVASDDIPLTDRVDRIIKAAKEKYPDTEVFFIEGFSSISGDGLNNYWTVASLLKYTTKYCTDNNMTVIGVCHTPKLKFGEGFTNPREMTLGSVAWGGYTETNMILAKDEKTSIISIFVALRNAKSEQYDFTFDENGRLVPHTLNLTGGAGLRLKLESLPTGEIITRSEMIAYGKAFGVTVPTVDRIAKSCVDDGILTREWGDYTRTDSFILTPSLH